jgi:NAD(P)-dependent dehydrogenase (short-subunit alcohol dehydrogenase family)
MPLPGTAEGVLWSRALSIVRCRLVLDVAAGLPPWLRRMRDRDQVAWDHAAQQAPDAARLVPHMNDGGSIIITSSIVGVKGDPGVCAYITAKHAQVGLMRVLAKEAVARNIRVNTVHPGPVDNPFQLNVGKNLSRVLGRDATAFFNEIIPLRRHVRAEEVARSALFLASDASSFTTGSVLMVDGGLSA